MNKIIIAVVIAALSSPLVGFSQNPQVVKLLMGTFEGRTPCRELSAQLNHPDRPECIKLKWRLQLYGDPGNNNKGTLTIEATGYRGEDKLTGTWILTKGMKSDPGALVYELLIPGHGSLYLWKMDDDMLYFLDHQKNLMVGDRDFNYVLSRAEKKTS